MAEGNVTAPEGQVFVCSACGKRSRDKWGTLPLNRGWDVSCSMHAVLCQESFLRLGDDGRVIEVREGGIVGEPEPS